LAVRRTECCLQPKRDRIAIERHDELTAIARDLGAHHRQRPRGVAGQRGGKRSAADPAAIDIGAVPDLDDLAVDDAKHLDPAPFPVRVAARDVPDERDIFIVAGEHDRLECGAQLVVIVADARDLLVDIERRDAVGVVTGHSLGAEFGNQLDPALVPYLQIIERHHLERRSRHIVLFPSFMPPLSQSRSRTANRICAAFYRPSRSIIASADLSAVIPDL